jgi:hypothetical protein
MKDLLMRGVRCFVVFLITPILSAGITAQANGQSSRLPLESTDAQLSKSTGSNPKPEDATTAILAAFGQYQVIAMGAAHGNKDLDDFILHLIRNPAFPSKLNDVVVECGNSLYQPILDRYMAGDDVPLSEVRQVWRNTTQPMCSVSGFYEELFPLLRRINQKLSPGRKLRVLAGDSPVDWSKVKTLSDLYATDRDVSIASVMEREVLSKHRKALMLFGIQHLLHGGRLAAGLYEKDYPGVTLVIADHVGFFNWSPLAKYNDELEARMASWPVPSLVRQVKGTWLEEIDRRTFQNVSMPISTLVPEICS